MAPEAIANLARRRRDEAVRRLREESRRRIERVRRRSAVSWCALATLAAGISLAAMDANDANLRRRAEMDAASARSAAVETVQQGEQGSIAEPMGLEASAVQRDPYAFDREERALKRAKRLAALELAHFALE